MEKKEITAKILEDAKEKAKEIVSEAEGRVNQILRDAREEAQEVERRLGEEAEELSKKEKSRILSLAEMEEKKKILREKVAVLEEAFQQALQYFQQRSEDEYRDIMRNLLAKSVNDGDEEVVVAKSDENRLNQEFLDSVNAELTRMGKKGCLTLAKENGDFQSGVLFRKERVETWCSLEVLLDILRNDLEIEVAESLFEPSE
jgi:V/A-type H+-transporting ATPase subunit E